MRLNKNIELHHPTFNNKGSLASSQRFLGLLVPIYMHDIEIQILKLQADFELCLVGGFSVQLRFYSVTVKYLNTLDAFNKVM